MSFTREDLAAYEAAAAAKATPPQPKDTKPVAAEQPVSATPAEATNTQDQTDASSASADGTDPAAPDDVSSAEDNNADSAPATSAEHPEGDSETEHEASAETQQPRAKKSARDRIADLVAEREAVKRQNEYLLNTIAAQQAQRAAQPAAAAPAVTAEVSADDQPPTLEQHEFDTAKLAKAQAAWMQRQIDKRVNAAMQGAQAQQAAQAARQAFETRTAEFKKTAPDFDLVVANPALPALSQTAARLVVTSEKGPQIAYHLAKNPDVAVRIARMAPEQQAMALGRLEAQLTAPAAKPNSVKKNVTQAPHPFKPVPAGSSPGKDPAQMSMKEFVEADRAQRLARLNGRRKVR